jgi:hypothetical protein
MVHQIMDEVELTKLMLHWRELSEELSAVELKIHDAVIDRGKSVTIAGVRAMYSKGRTTYAYKEAVLYEFENGNGAVRLAVIDATKPGNLKDSIYSEIAKKIGLDVESTTSAPSVSISMPRGDEPGPHVSIHGGEVEERS